MVDIRAGRQILLSAMEGILFNELRQPVPRALVMVYRGDRCGVLFVSWHEGGLAQGYLQSHLGRHDDSPSSTGGGARCVRLRTFSFVDIGDERRASGPRHADTRRWSNRFHRRCWYKQFE